MNNYDLLYSSKVGVNTSDLESETDSDNELSDFEDDKINIKKEQKYQSKLYHIFISSLHRTWKDSNTGTFNFQVRFNPSYDSLEEKKILSNMNRNVEIQNINYYGTDSVAIPVDIKNIESLHVSKLIIPNRQNYLGNGVMNKTINLNTLLLHIDEFSYTVYGSNEALTNTFCVLSSTNIDENLNYIEYDNMSEQGKIFKPVPLNSLNSLTLKITDSEGNTLKYLNEFLKVASISVDMNTSFIKIITSQYFSRLNYKEGDIICIESITSSNLVHKTLIEFLNNKKGHNIYYLNNDGAKNNHLETLHNQFYISKKGEYNLTNGDYIIDSKLDYSNLEDIQNGNIINKNLQILFKLDITCRENDTSFFNPEII